MVVRGEIVAIDPTPEAMQALRQAGFTLGAQRVLDPLALRVLMGDFSEGDTITVDGGGEDLSFTKAETVGA